MNCERKHCTVCLELGTTERQKYWWGQADVVDITLTPFRTNKWWGPVPTSPYVPAALGWFVQLVYNMGPCQKLQYMRSEP